MVPEKIKNFSFGIVALLFFIYLFVIYNTSFSGPDKPIYFAYTASIVEDGDLNAVNHLGNSYPYRLASGKIGISETYNLPDFHDHGGIILWAPFYAYAKFVYHLADRFNLRDLIKYDYGEFTRCAMAFSTILFGFLTMLFTYKLSRLFFSRYISIWSTLAVFIGTPFFYFVVQETGNANIVACLFSIISIWFCVYAINMKKAHWFLFGLFFSICMVVKVDLCFQIVFILILFIVLVIRKQTQWLCGASFLLGLAPVISLKLINGYIKYGTFRLGVFGTLNPKGDYLFEQLFSSYRGVFYTSPIFYFCLLGLILASVNIIKNLKESNNNTVNGFKMNDIFLVILTSYLFIKVFFLGYRYAWGGGTCGARPLLTEFPIFVLLYARVLGALKKYAVYIFSAISVLFIFWNLLVVSEYKTELDLSYITKTPNLITRVEAIGRIPASILFKIKNLDLKLKTVFPLLIFSCIGIIWLMRRWRSPVRPFFWYAKSENLNSFYKALSLFTMYLCLAYLLFTLANVYNNKRKVEKLKSQGFFTGTEILSPKEFEREENVGSMNEMIRYYKLKCDFNRVERIRDHKKELYGDSG
jgi:hypothetical protein